MKARPAEDGERDLAQLLAGARPALKPGQWVFVRVASRAAALKLRPLGFFVEDEGVTAICRRARATAAGNEGRPAFRQITLTVHSSLNAVGFIAAVSRVLAARGIPCNVVSAVHHDHLFVPVSQAEEAMAAIAALSSTASRPRRMRAGP